MNADEIPDACDEGHCLFLQSSTLRDGYVGIVAEAFRPNFASLQPMLASLAEPTSRPALVHEYKLTPFSLGAAISNGLSAEEAVAFLEEHSYGFKAGAPVHSEVCGFVHACMCRYNLARIVVDNQRTTVQCRDEGTARLLLGDAVIRTVAAQPPVVRFESFSWKDETHDYPFFELQNRGMAKAVAARCALLGLPIQQQYEFERDTSIRTAHMTLRSQTRPRRYQVEAVEAAVADGVLSSGCLLLPCGAGKTLVGIMLMCKVRKPTLVVCAGSVSVEQWKIQILEYAALLPPISGSDSNSKCVEEAHSTVQRSSRAGATRIACLTGKQKDEIDQDTDVVLTTYSMLVCAHKALTRRSATEASVRWSTARAGECSDAFSKRGTHKRKRNPKDSLFDPFGLLILDEVHVIPAEAFRESLSFVDVKGVIGLTATYVREDQKIIDLFHLIGPKLFDISMETLAAQGFLAKVNCVEVHAPMTKEYGLEYIERSVQFRSRQQESSRHVPVQVMLAAANPNKMICVQELVRRHLLGGAKILVFCDHIMLLHEYGRVLGAPVICGSTPHKERLMLFSEFQSTAKVNVICISRVGDVSVNLPSASVVVQVSSHGGSRRQEAQRLGRILRPKERTASGKAAEAWFYSIISMDTLEMGYAAHRTAFLMDQGYTCRIMEFDPGHDNSDSPGAQSSSHVPASQLGFSVNQPIGSSIKGHLSPASSVKSTPLIGDTATIKLEAAEGMTSFNGPNGARQQRQHNDQSGDSAPGLSSLSSTVAVHNLRYQLDLLARVVSSWEIEFQKQQRRDGVATVGAEVAADNESNSGDDVVEVQPDHTYEAIKMEWQPSGAASTHHHGVPLHDLVGVDDGFVYHEL